MRIAMQAACHRRLRSKLFLQCESLWDWTALAKVNIVPINWPETRNTFDDDSHKWASLHSDMPTHPSYQWWSIYFRKLRKCFYKSFVVWIIIFYVVLVHDNDIAWCNRNVCKQNHFAEPSFVRCQLEKLLRSVLDFRPPRLWPVAYASACRLPTPKSNWTMHWMSSTRLATIWD